MYASGVSYTVWLIGGDGYEVAILADVIIIIMCCVSTRGFVIRYDSDTLIGGDRYLVDIMDADEPPVLLLSGAVRRNSRSCDSARTYMESATCASTDPYDFFLSHLWENLVIGQPLSDNITMETGVVMYLYRCVGPTLRK